MERIQIRYQNLSSEEKIFIIFFLTLFIIGVCVLIVYVLHLGKEVEEEKSQAKQVKAMQGKQSTHPYSSKRNAIATVTMKKGPDRTSTVTSATTVKTNTVVIPATQVKEIQGEQSTPPYTTKRNTIAAVTVKKIADRTSTVTSTTTVKTTAVIFPACLTGWTKFRESCYKPFYIKKNWDSAQYACSFINPGRNSMLVEIRSKQENEFLLTVIDVRRNFWTGGNDLANEGQYVWNSDNQRFKYTNWQRGQPRSGSYTHGRNENCMLVEGGNGGMWHDYPCYKEFEYICEMSTM